MSQVKSNNLHAAPSRAQSVAVERRPVLVAHQRNAQCARIPITRQRRHPSIITHSATSDASNTAERAETARQASIASGGGDGFGRLAGIFIKDQAASDVVSYERALDLLQLTGLQKVTALNLVEGIEIEQQWGNRIAVRFLTVVPFFKITEIYTLGRTTSMSRRDLRPGSQTALAGIEPDGTVTVGMQWGEPNAGGVDERFSLLDANTLEVVAEVKVAAGTERTRTIYRRQDSWKPKNAWNPLAAFGRM